MFGIAGDVIKSHSVGVTQVVVILDSRVALDDPHDLGAVLRVTEVGRTSELFAFSLVGIQVVGHYLK